MVFYKEEEDMLKCWKHPSKHGNGGVCPICLRDCLLQLCPNCANKRHKCSCYPTSTTTTTSSSSSSSSYSLSSSHSDVPTSFKSGGIGVTGRMSNLIDNEPAFQRSRSSAAFPFFRSKISDTKDSNFSRLPPMGNRNANKSSSFWSSVFKISKLKKVEEEEEVIEEKKNLNFKMMRSKSVGIPSSTSEVKSKGRKSGWNFPSPIKAFPFRQSNTKVVHERSPLCRG